MEAEHFTRAVATAPVQWQRVPDLGRTASAMTPTPVTSKSQTLAAASPRLEYRMFLFDSGTVTVRTYLSPTLDFSGSPQGVRYAISFDDEAPQVVNAAADTSLSTWNTMVGDNIAKFTSRHQLHKPGEHVLKFWMVDAGIVVQKFVVLVACGPATSARRRAFGGRSGDTLPVSNDVMAKVWAAYDRYLCDSIHDQW